MAKTKTIKAVVGVQKISDAEFLKQLNTVHDRVNGNTNFPNPPVDMPTFKTAIDTLTVLVTDAADGGRKAISAKQKHREVVMKMYKQLGHYIEAACDGDMAKFNTSGFVPASTTRTPPQPLPPATFEYIDRGPKAGDIVVKVKPIPKAMSYDVHFAVLGNGGTPGAWTSQTLTSPKKTTISNLTPGATYAFQVRALGRLGYTDWSDSMTFICG